MVSDPYLHRSFVLIHTQLLNLKDIDLTFFIVYVNLVQDLV